MAPKKLVPGERQDHGGNSSPASRMRGSAPAMVNDQRCAREKPAMRRISDHEKMIRQRGFRKTRPARIKENAFPFQGVKKSAQQRISLEPGHAAESQVNRRLARIQEFLQFNGRCP